MCHKKIEQISYTIFVNDEDRKEDGVNIVWCKNFESINLLGQIVDREVERIICTKAMHIV